MFITGVINNPLTLLSRQLDTPLQLIDEDKCELIFERDGASADPMMDKRVEKEFNVTLDRLAEWRCGLEEGKIQDSSLESKLIIN